MKIFTDGGARGNPGPAACAFVIFDDAGNLRHKCGNYLGTGTNNEAEYNGVIEALSYLMYLVDLSNLKASFFLDSLLVVNQINGLWKIKEPRLRELLMKVRELEGALSPVQISYSHVPRDQNKDADLLVNETLDNVQRHPGA